MTEDQWAASADPVEMLEFLGSKATSRKLRLYGVVCCRWWANALDERCLKALDVAERFADGLATREDVMAEWGPVDEALGEYIVDHSPLGRLRESAAANVLGALELDFLAIEAPDFAWPEATFWESTLLPASKLLRELFGNPFRPAVLDRAWVVWNDGAVRKMAQAIYDGRRFGDLPILADALEDAGCDDADILAHCRGGGDHVRGCWVVDLLLGKE